VGPRRCTSAKVENLPRGALCEADADCGDGLTCGAAKGEPKRCGVACESDPSVCRHDSVCTRTGLSEITGIVFNPQQPLPAFKKVAARIATCFPLVDDGGACLVHAQCAGGACCDGICGSGDPEQQATANLRTGGCSYSATSDGSE
jgi:hypothetical protein